jgi:predicted MPP superfamily phosphohydrolase
MHAYAFFRARVALGFGAGAGIALAVFMLAMTFAPFLIRLLEKHEYQLAARLLSYLAYFWMAALFLFFCSSIILDIVNLLYRIVGLMARIGPAPIPANASFFISIGLSLVICFTGYFSALDIRTERVRIETAKLPAGIDRLTIVQISDVHLGLIVRCSRLKKIMAIVKAEKPDIFISSGDLVDAQINQMTGMAELLREVKARYGNYAITGNHEFFAGIDQALAFTREAGFTVLRNESVSSGPITIAGVDDRAGVQLGLILKVSEKKLLESLPRNKFTLFLKHQPHIDPETQGLFDLQLSGHTHKGQIYPFTYVSKIAYPLNAGLFHLPGGSVLYVSRGSGTWGPPIRFLSPPEVTVIELVRKA